MLRPSPAVRIVLALILSFAALNSLPAAELKVGDKAPEFKMQASDGKEYALKDFVGKKAVVIAWFPKAFTGGCTKECKSMAESSKLLMEFEAAYFTASTDTPEVNAKFANSLKLNYPILCDPEGKNAEMFGVLRKDRNVASRVTFVIGKDGKILKIEDKVKTTSHGQDIAAMLDLLNVKKAAKKAAEKE